MSLHKKLLRTSRIFRVYHAIVMIPDFAYPFKAEVNGRWVRGIRAYNATLARYQRMYGVGHYGFKLGTYREACHLVGSWFFLIIAAYVSHSLLSSTLALYAFLVVALAFFTFQEFYLHRRLYKQLFGKSVLDWLSWCAPIGAYLVSLVR